MCGSNLERNEKQNLLNCPSTEIELDFNSIQRVKGPTVVFSSNHGIEYFR